MDTSAPLKMETLPMSGKFALVDVLDNVCRCLKIKDLLNVALVCRSWFEAASREIAKRGPEIVLLPDIYNKNIENLDFHPYNLLNAQPHVALLFVGPSKREREGKEGLEFEILKKYRKYFQHYLVTVGVDESKMNEEVINSYPGLLGEPNGILGLFLPRYRDLKFKTSFHDFDFSPEKLINDLLPEDNQAKSTLIIFCNKYHYEMTEVIKQIKNKFAQKMYTLWGGIFDDILKVVRCKELEEKHYQRTAIFGLNITGSSIESWSTVVDCRIKRRAFDEKLLLLRDRLRLRRCTIGLACGPRYVEDRRGTTTEEIYRNSFEIMSSVKKFFPKIPFISIFNYGYHGHFGVDSTSDDCKQQLSTQMSLSLMIITYN